MSTDVPRPSRSRRGRVLVALVLLLGALWALFTVLARPSLSTAGGFTAVADGREIHMPFSLGGGAARTVTVTVDQQGCVGIDDTPALWPHGTRIGVKDGQVWLWYAGRTYHPGDRIDIAAIGRRVVEATSLEGWGFRVPTECGERLVVVRDGFSLAGD